MNAQSGAPTRRGATTGWSTRPAFAPRAGARCPSPADAARAHRIAHAVRMLTSSTRTDLQFAMWLRNPGRRKYYTFYEVKLHVYSQRSQTISPTK